jgi:molybdopterin converting factor small subunit
MNLDERLWRSLAVAVNREYSPLNVVLRDGDEVALLPPVSGGLLRFGCQARIGDSVRC